MFSTQSDICIPICPLFGNISLFAAELEEHKIGISGKGLKAVGVGFYPWFAQFLSEGEKQSVGLNEYCMECW